MAALLELRHFKFALTGCLAATACYVASQCAELAGDLDFRDHLLSDCADHNRRLPAEADATIWGSAHRLLRRVYERTDMGFTLHRLHRWVHVLFIAVTAAAAWVATSSPRLAYAGAQLAVAFDLINLQEFHFNTSLYDARDRACGILLGLLMMWVFFDQLWSTPAGVLMRKTFHSTFRQLALLAREPVATSVREAVERSYTLRETINSQFDQVRAQAGAVLFEFGASRRRDLAFRGRIREWGPQLRALFIMRIAALKYELQTPGFEVPEGVRLRQQAYDELSARLLEQLADHIEGRAELITSGSGELRAPLSEALQNVEVALSRELPPAKAQSLITLLGAIDELTSRLQEEISAEPADCN